MDLEELCQCLGLKIVPHDHVLPQLSGSFSTVLRVFSDAFVHWCFVSGIQEKNIEFCQIQALHIICGAQAYSYEANLSKLGLESFTVMRQDKMQKYIIASYRDPNQRHLYTPSPHFH